MAIFDRDMCLFPFSSPLLLMPFLGNAQTTAKLMQDRMKIEGIEQTFEKMFVGTPEFIRAMKGKSFMTLLDTYAVVWSVWLCIFFVFFILGSCLQASQKKKDDAKKLQKKRASSYYNSIIDSDRSVCVVEGTPI